MNTLPELFDALTRELRKGTPLKELWPVLIGYTGTDWKEYEIYHPDHYQRNHILKNEIAEIVLLCWKPGQGCLPHDHPDGGCLLTVVKGKLRENTYHYDGTKQFVKKSIVYKGMTGYKEGKEVLHSVMNHTNLRAVSLHVYAPPDYRPEFY